MSRNYRVREAGPREIELEGLFALREQVFVPTDAFEGIKQRAMMRIHDEALTRMFGCSRKGLIALGIILFVSGLGFGAGIARALGAFAVSEDTIDEGTGNRTQDPDLGLGGDIPVEEPLEFTEAAGAEDRELIWSLGY